MSTEDFKEFSGETIDQAKEKAMDYFNSKSIEFELIPPKLLSMFSTKNAVRIKAKMVEVTGNIEEYKVKTRALLEELLKLAKLNVTITEEFEDKTIRYSLAGEDEKLFTSDKGLMLESFQHILVKSLKQKYNDEPTSTDATDVNAASTEAGQEAASTETKERKHRRNNGINIIVDAGEYKRDREDFVKNYAARAISQVKRNGETYIMKPMNAGERRVVHLMVQLEGLKSESLGDGNYKKIKIDHPNFKGDSRGTSRYSSRRDGNGGGGYRDRNGGSDRGGYTRRSNENRDGGFKRMNNDSFKDINEDTFNATPKEKDIDDNIGNK